MKNSIRENKMEHIIFAAIKVNHCIFFGKHHGECIQKAAKSGIADTKENRVTQRCQGFLTNKYRYVLRKEAACIAYAAEQIKTWKPEKSLLSEMIWENNPMIPGGGTNWEYNENLGYVKKKNVRLNK